MQRGSLPKMNNNSLKEQLNRALALNRLYQAEDYQQVLLPALNELSQVKPLNPKLYPNREDFNREVDMMFARASAFDDIITLLENTENAINQIRKQMEQPERNWKQ